MSFDSAWQWALLSVAVSLLLAFVALAAIVVWVCHLTERLDSLRRGDKESKSNGQGEPPGRQ
jgi:hypothetical protein